MNDQITLKGLHPFEYEHPFDAKSLNLLHDTLGLEKLSRKFIKDGMERYYTIQYQGSNLRITEDNYPEICSELVKACKIIHLNVIPDLYVESDGDINASSVGIDHPLVVITSGAIDKLSVSELAFLLGHELGHIKSRHVLYHLMANSLTEAGNIVGDFTLGIGKLLTLPLQFALLRWSRMSEFTADRSGLLTCQDFDSVVSTFIKIAGLPDKFIDNINIKAFLKQASEFEELEFEKANKWLKLAANVGRTHPWTVLRSAELMKWIDCGEYQNVLDRNTSERIYIRYEGTTQFCRKCGYRLQGAEKFCNSCGQSLR